MENGRDIFRMYSDWGIGLERKSDEMGNCGATGFRIFMWDDGDVSVSYTHLDVYKRQEQVLHLWEHVRIGIFLCVI